MCSWAIALVAHVVSTVGANELDGGNQCEATKIVRHIVVASNHGSKPKPTITKDIDACGCGAVNMEVGSTSINHYELQHQIRCLSNK